jgi:pimeloyl-ACP methyl ester carboxylesterase
VQPTPDSPPDTRDTKYMMGMATAETYSESYEAFKLALFGPSQEGARTFENYWKRLQESSVESPLLDPVPLEKGGKNQIAAVLNADKPENMKEADPLAALHMPTLIANGNDDLTLGLVRTLDLHERLKNSQLILYPRSGHGFLWQYGELFAEHVNTFLDSRAFDTS